MDRFEKRILSFIRDNELIVKGDRIVTGFSGGADSVALLLALNNLKAILKAEVAAVHVNHGLRDAEADRDEAFCRELAGARGIEFKAVRVDVKGLVKDSGMSEEEAARVLRYEALNMAGLEMFGEGFKIAVAHHADDQAETILFNMLRGTGMRGMGGIRAKRGNIIRPMLRAEKQDILKWLNEKGQAFVTDSTNLENDHARNAIRNLVMPELKENVNLRAAEHIASAGERISLADAYLSAEARAYLLSLPELTEVRPGGLKALRLGKEDLKEKPQIFRIYVIIEGLKMSGVPMKDWGERHFQDIDKLLFLGKGAHVDLPGGVTAENIYRETLIISGKNGSKKQDGKNEGYDKYIDLRV